MATSGNVTGTCIWNFQGKCFRGNIYLPSYLDVLVVDRLTQSDLVGHTVGVGGLYDMLKYNGT